MSNTKYYLRCVNCNYITNDFNQWFSQSQTCPKCGSKHSEVWYNTDYVKLKSLFETQAISFWHYFDYLPLTNKNNIVSEQEGAVPIESWTFLEDIALKYFNISIKVYAYRNDLSAGTGTLKDVAASLAASVLKENNIANYCIASTGNSATAFSKYLSLANIKCSVFMHDEALEASEVFIKSYGQDFYRIAGDYTQAKEIAAAYSKKFNVLMSSGNIDPLRVEAKKTMLFEIYRQLKFIPSTYIQAVSGGTGPIALDKGIRELQTIFPNLKLPKLIMVQTSECNPMSKSWEKASASGFPSGFEKEYFKIENPKTQVPTLATGIPAAYPIVAKLVKKTNGEFITIEEDSIMDNVRLVANERKIMIGPASAVCVAGFFRALKNNLINNNETVLLNIGEGINRAPDIVEKIFSKSEEKIKNIDDICSINKQNNDKEILLQKLIK